MEQKHGISRWSKGSLRPEKWNQSMEEMEFKYLQMEVLPSNMGKHGEVSSDESFAIECGQALSLYPKSYDLSILIIPVYVLYSSFCD